MRPVSQGMFMMYRAGQSWTYRPPAGFETSRLVIGAIARFGNGAEVLCCAVMGAPRKRRTGELEAVTIPFLPMTPEAFAASALALDGAAEPPEGFEDGLAAWQDDPLGLTMFTVPFEGFLDRLIARQMEAIVGQSAA
jgi:hypothetical protein